MAEFIGLTRERIYSPGRVADDAAILRLVALELTAAGHPARTVDTDIDGWPQPRAGDVVFAMAQGPEALERMTAWQAAGVRVVNSPEAILNCQRHRTVPLLREASVGFPDTRLIDTAEAADLPDWSGERMWLKRGDVHATDPADVTAVSGRVELRAALAEFARRGIARAAVQRHVDGPVVKFYGVRGGFFFPVPTPVMPLSTAQSARLHAAGHAAARALGVEVFGGDGICDADGEVHIVDLNDWPSFSACRSEAAPAIAAYLLACRRAAAPSN